jgi:hypothetical protein
VNDLSITPDKPVRIDNPADLLTHLSLLVSDALIVEEGVKYNEETGDRKRYLVLKVFLKDENEA